MRRLNWCRLARAALTEDALKIRPPASPFAVSNTEQTGRLVGVTLKADPRAGRVVYHCGAPEYDAERSSDMCVQHRWS